MKIFLTGSTSYLGSKFIDLYGSKYDILAVSAHDTVTPVDLLNKEQLTKVYKNFNPDAIVHLAADKGRDFTTKNTITKTNPEIVQTLIELALPKKIPFIYTSSEAIYGGKWNKGDYIENDEPEPRNFYGESKVASEKLLRDSGLPYLITRGHRYVGIASPSFNSMKQFPDTIKSLMAGDAVHLDSNKIFTPVLINNICDIFDYYIENDTTKQVVYNVGIDKKTTYYEFIKDVARKLGLDEDLIINDGIEEKWPQNSSLNFAKIQNSEYPNVTYEQALEIIKSDFEKFDQ